MLQAYIDDSGSHNGSPVCLVAGYWGGVGQWRKFERAWKAVLDEYHVDEFHAKIFWGRDKFKQRLGAYKDWPEQRRHQFMFELLRVIGSFKLYPFASGILDSEWKKQSRGWQLILSGATSKYPNANRHPIFMAFRTAAMRAVGHCYRGVTMHFVFDSNKNLDGWASICYAELKRRAQIEKTEWASSLGEFTVADSKKALPLQAADLLAYEAFKYVQFAKGDKNVEVRPQYALALKNFRSIEDFRLFDEERMNGLMKAITTAYGQDEL